MDNLREGAVKRLMKNWMPALFTLLTLMGAIGLPLRSLNSLHRNHGDALLNAHRAAKLRNEFQVFQSAGGDQVISEMSRTSAALLPRDLSVVEVRAAVQILAGASGLKLESLSVSEFAPTKLATLDDSVGLSEIHLSGSGGLNSLSKILFGMKSWGYPISVRSFQLDRLSASEVDFEVYALLELFQAIPPQAAPESDDLSTESE